MLKLSKDLLLTSIMFVGIDVQGYGRDSSKEKNPIGWICDTIIPYKCDRSFTLVIVIVIVISRFLKRYSKAKRTRAPAYSRALRRIKGGSKGGQEKLKSDFQSTRRPCRPSFYVQSMITFLRACNYM